MAAAVTGSLRKCFWRLPVTAFAGAWSRVLRTLMLAFLFASLSAFACYSTAFSVGGLCIMGHCLPWLKCLEGKVTGINATCIQLFLPLVSRAGLSTDTELVLRGIRGDKTRLFENRGQSWEINSLVILRKEVATVTINLVKALNYE